MATYYPYPPSQFDRDHYTSHRSQQHQWHNSFQTSLYDDSYNEQPSWSTGNEAVIVSTGQTSSGSCSYTPAGVLTTPRATYPLEASYGELDFCRSPSNRSTASNLQGNQFTLCDETRPSSTQLTSAASATENETTENEEAEMAVVVKQEDDASCFIMELSAPQVHSTLISQSLAPPIEVPLRATHASRKMRRMMSSFRCNPFAMHAGGDSAMAPDREEAKPHEEEPLVFEFQLENYIHDCPFDCDTDMLVLDTHCDDEEKRRPAFPKGLLRAFSPDFELHSDSVSVFGISSENDFDPATSASSASLSDHVGSEWGDYDLEGPGSASSYAPSEELTSLSRRSAQAHGYVRGRGLAQARVIKPSPTCAHHHHASSTSSLLTNSQEHSACYQDYQKEDNASAQSTIPTPSGSGFHLPRTPTSPPPTRPNSAATSGRFAPYENITQAQTQLEARHSNLTGPGINASSSLSHSRSSPSNQSNGSAGVYGAGDRFHAEPGSSTSSPPPTPVVTTSTTVSSQSQQSSHLWGSQYPSRVQASSPYGMPASGASQSISLTSMNHWSSHPRMNSGGSGLHYSASGMPPHTIGIPMGFTSRSCANVYAATNMTGAGQSNGNISVLPSLTSAHRRWSLPDNVSTSNPQSYNTQFLV